MSSPTDTSLPYSREFEIAVLGHLLTESESVVTYEQCKAHGIEAKHFCLDAHQRIYAGAVSLLQQGLTASIERVADVLRKRGELDTVRGPAYLLEITELIVKGHRLGYELEAIREAWKKRQLIQLGQQIYDGGYNGIASVAMIDSVRSVLQTLEARAGPGPVLDLSILRLKHGRDIVPRDQGWIVPDSIPAATLASIIGDVGLGKTTMGMSICADITQGRIPIIGGEREPGNVLFISNEDSEAHLRALFERLGGDLERLYVEDEDAELPWSLADIPLLEERIKATKAVITVIDSLSSYCAQEVNLNYHAETAHMLVPVRKLAVATECLILLVHHDNKAQTDDPIRKAANSKGVTGTARHNILIGKDKDDDNARIAVTFKTNIAKDRNCAYRFQLDPFEWKGRVAITARELLAPSTEPPQSAGKLEEAKKYIADYLKNGREELAAKIKGAAEKEKGIAERTLQRAAEEIGVQMKPQGFPAKTFWSLPVLSSAKPN